MISLCSLFSGSDGNALLLRTEDRALLIDCGVSARSLSCALLEAGQDPSALDGILITHEHSDHVKGLEVFLRRHPCPVHIAAPSAAALAHAEALRPYLTLHEPDFTLSLGSLSVRAFPVPHDSACCVGYRIEQEDDAVCIATDLGRITRPIVDAFLGARGVVLECNHDPVLLQDNPRYPPALKARIGSGGGHLKNEDCARFLAYLAEHGTTCALLAHLSTENNTPARALSAVAHHLKAPLSVAVAPRCGTTYLGEASCSESPFFASAR